MGPVCARVPLDLANVAVTLVAIHICEVLIVSFETRENLILGMITGRKKNIDHI
jgi:cytochrome b